MACSRGMGPWNHGSMPCEGMAGEEAAEEKGKEEVKGEEAEEEGGRRESIRGGGLTGVVWSLCTESELSYWRMLASQCCRCSEKVLCKYFIKQKVSNPNHKIKLMSVFL